ncbi:hypothetical protein D9758_006776 [Tetrapyrgos nigripes]|uniref:Nab2 type CCCH zinc finger 4 domain-containing protein n=1 Tax=Tetrapyrgos nigripes TaxID=182062 RepID=A0A8H5CW77_9AGAR|nr:hypothetical protein D9758_006776 [Tetrapyrgos nigripes]
MPFGLTIGTDRATALQNSIQDELINRGFSPDADPVMAEYITIMIINNKTADQITAELEDLIGADFDRSFTDWLFAEAAKGSPENETSRPATSPSTEQPPPLPTTSNDSSRRVNQTPRNGVYQQAISQALPSSSNKRSASARSPSPNHPNKIRRTDLPTGPRAMQRDGQSNSRSLIDRMSSGPPPGNHQNGLNQRDEIQARIDNIVNSDPSMMMAGGFPAMNGMDMNAMNGMGNPVMLQELMMNQMALMAQITGMINPGQFGGFPVQGMMPGGGDMTMMQNMGMNGFQGAPHGHGQGGRGGRGGRGRGGGDRGRGGAPASVSTPKPEDKSASTSDTQSSSAAVPIVAPTPSATVPAPSATPSTTPALARPAYAVPERPQSPTLCKFGLLCTNAHCRWSHPSPVATPESGVVLSNDPCEQGKDCKDKDCVKAHVSPAVLKPHQSPAPPQQQPPSSSFPPPNTVPCRFGTSCTRPGCTFSHPRQSSNSHYAQPCRFGASCTKATCPFQHPEGRVLPTSFHRGLSTTAPLVTVPNPEPGSIGGPSPHKSVTFNQSGAGIREKLQKQMKEIEEKKSEAEKAVKEAEAAAAASGGKKDDSKPVPIAV